MSARCHLSIDSGDLETTAVHAATVGSLLRFLNKAIPWVWVISHIPNAKYEWWRTQVPLNDAGSMFSGDVRLVQYDLQLSTSEFLMAAVAFEDSGISLIQSRQRMPATLDLRWNMPNRNQILRLNGAFLSIDLPHANETAVVACYESGYLSAIAVI